MYDHSSGLIVGGLFMALIVAIEAGHWFGSRFGRGANESAKAQINTIQASLLGVLALLLGFTFSLALQRYDSRSEAVVAEANAIGTAALRAGLLPKAVRAETQDLIKQYLALRVRAGAISLDQAEEREVVVAESSRVFAALWSNASRATAEDPNPVTTGLFVQALNDMIDAYGVRDAALARHVPEIVLFLVFGTFVLTASLVGYASGVGAHRVSFATYLLVLLITCLVFIIIDLDRPRRGLIEISQKSMLDLQTSLPAQ
jgi:hypothetical protein